MGGKSRVVSQEVGERDLYKRQQVHTTLSKGDASHTDALECVSQFLHGIVATRVVRGTGAYSASLSFNMSKGVRQQERVRKMERVQWGPA